MSSVNKSKAQSGFSIIELMGVMAIVGILAAVAIPAYQDYAGRAKVSEGLHAAGGIQTQIAEYHSSHGRFPATGAMSLGADDNLFEGQHVRSIRLQGDCSLMIEFRLSELGGMNKLRVIPAFINGTYQWRYSNAAESGGIPDGYLPFSTRQRLDDNFSVDPTLCQAA